MLHLLQRKKSHKKVMRERLIELMNILKLTPTQFANAISVQRATLQHILTGRNEPSLKIIKAVHDSFPQIDLEWLLDGKGNAFGDSTLDHGLQSESNDYPLFSEIENSNFPESIQETEKFLNVSDQAKRTQRSKKTYNKELSQTTAPGSGRTATHIKEIVVFYEDGTYQKFLSDLKN